jgi:hypothetical protein
MRLPLRGLRVVWSVALAVVLFSVLMRVLSPWALIPVGLGIAVALQLAIVAARRLRLRFANRFAKPL